MGKLFVLVRRNLALGDQGAQGLHALAQWMLENPTHEWQNQTLVFLTVEDEAHLHMWCDKLRRKGIRYSKFCEPDIDNQMTGLACFSFDKNLFGKLKLMGA